MALKQQPSPKPAANHQEFRALEEIGLAREGLKQFEEDIAARAGGL
jgi:hypothetical protein